MIPGAGRTRAQALARTRAALAEAGVDTAALDARLLLCDVARIDHAALVTHPDAVLALDAARRLDEALARRLAGEPVARIVGTWDFWGMPFRLSPQTLVPRPDTETLVEAVLARTPDRTRPLRLLDLGTGSGCILVALLSELPNALGLGVDRSPAALATARDNAAINGVGGRAHFVAGDWGTALRGGFDLIVSNPPYIPTADIATLAPEVRCHDPGAALDGGASGLDAYRSILAGVGRDRLLTHDGLLVVEIGPDQAGSVAELAGLAGLDVEAVERDLGGRPRVVAMRHDGLEEPREKTLVAEG